VVVADLADEKGKALEQELGVRYVRTDATDEGDVRAAMTEAQTAGPLRISSTPTAGRRSAGGSSARTVSLSTWPGSVRPSTST
jgi:hypothetical protein